MKKVFALVLSLALVFGLSLSASAALEDVQADAQAVLSELSATYGVDEVKAAFEEGLAGLGDIDLLNVDALPADAGSDVAASVISKLGLEGTDIADQLQGVLSNDFVSFIAGIYVGDVITEEPTEAPEVTTQEETEVVTEVVTEATTAAPAVIPETGSSSAIAITTFATLSAAAAVAFVCMKKKED
ncbi:MAG: hypothetical protein LBB50_01935 [Oscillospiraceae bacterium]|jgi:hypothetical protein|nr:hypothetical protein [Oscillospiraceae bacterium]